MSKKKALGSMGLDALLSIDDNFEDEISPDIQDAIQLVPLEEIITNPDQPRKNFSEESLKELSESIRSKGVIQPIILEQRGSNYVIVAGERRYRASLLAETVSIPAIIRDFTEEEKLEIALIENIQREDLSPIEEAMAYKHIMDSVGFNQQQVADKVGKKRSTIANSLRLLNLPGDIQDSVSSGIISSGHARAILACVNPADQKILHSRIKSDGLSVREAERMVEDLNKGKRIKEKEAKRPPLKNKEPEVLNIEQKFIDRFGTKVQVKGNLKKGKIEISYFHRMTWNESTISFPDKRQG